MYPEAGSHPTAQTSKPSSAATYDLKLPLETFRVYESSRLVFQALSLSPIPRAHLPIHPWSQHPAPSSISNITVSSILTFLKHKTGIQNSAAKMAVRWSLLRFRPDKSGVLLKKIEERERERVREGCIAVARCWNEINERV